MQQTANSLVKRDFGSFFSSNVNDLVNLSDTDYISPNLNIQFDSRSYQNLENKFGTKELKEKLFFLTDEFKYLNHGAFGLTFKPALELVFKWEAYAESQPLKFYDREIMPLLADLIRLFAKKLLHCEPNELVLVENCTFAFNSILNSISLKPNEKILIYSTTYGVYSKILRDKCVNSQALLVEIKVELPILSETDLNQKFIDSLLKILEEDSEDKLIKYVFVDHIPSNIPFVLPIRMLSDVCKAKRSDVVFIVDGAHTLGSVRNFSLKELPNVDLMFMNCHKWLCGPKGTAFLFKKRESSCKVSPAIQSHGFGNSFVSEFIWTGLKQYSSYLGLYAVLAIWEDCLGGFDNVINYCTNLVREAGELLVKAWSSTYLVDPILCTTFLCVKLPLNFILYVLNDRNLSSFKYEHAEVIQNFFHYDQRIEVPVKCVGGELYVRISCHLYNNLDEFKYLSEIVADRMD